MIFLYLEVSMTNDASSPRSNVVFEPATFYDDNKSLPLRHTRLWPVASQGPGGYLP